MLLQMGAAAQQPYKYTHHPTLPNFLVIFFFCPHEPCCSSSAAQASARGWCQYPARGSRRETERGSWQLGLIAFQTWRNHSWSLTKPRPRDSELRPRQGDRWEGFKRLLMEGRGGGWRGCCKIWLLSDPVLQSANTWVLYFFAILKYSFTLLNFSISALFTPSHCYFYIVTTLSYTVCVSQKLSCSQL